MPTTHKILSEFCEETFALLALHCSLEDHAVAYAINQKLGTQLKRATEDLDIDQNACFPFFEWKDELNQSHWILFKNSSTTEENLNQTNLFPDTTSYLLHHLIPEHKEADYLLKIEQEDWEADPELVASLLSIPKVITAYALDGSTLKSRENLNI